MAATQQANLEAQASGDGTQTAKAGKRKISKNDIPVSVGFKLLIFSISIVLFALVAVALFALFADNTLINNLKEGTATLGENFAVDLVVSIGVVSLVMLIEVAAVVFYIVVLVVSRKGADMKYCRFFRRTGGTLGFILFVIVALCAALLLSNFVLFPKTLMVAYIVAAILAYLPVSITWRIYEEDRLKNFIDGFSKACSTMAFMSGAIAFIVKSFL